MKLALILLLTSKMICADTSINKFNVNESSLVLSFERITTINKKNYTNEEKNILKKWNMLNLSSKKVFVNYYNENNIRLIIDYEKGIIELESLGKNKEELKKVLNSIIDEKAEFKTIVSMEELTKDKVSKSKMIEAIINKVHEGKLRFDLIGDQINVRAKRYQSLILKWSKINNLEPELVKAIIRQESAFNPRAVSPIPAYGLMQIVPKYAGRDVMITVIEKDEIPTKERLFDPEGNLLFGTCYLKLLEDKFSTFTNDKEKIQHLVIASYNWGPQRILNAMKAKRIDLNKSNLYQQIINIAPEETKNYLKKVTSFKKDYLAKE